MEWAAKRLRVGGKFSFITQNRYLSREYGKTVQQLLTGKIVSGVVAEIIIDLGETGGRLFFPNETNYPCITVARRLPQGEGSANQRARLVRLVPDASDRDLPSPDELFGAVEDILEELTRADTAEIEITGGRLVGSGTTIEHLAQLTESEGRWPIPLQAPERDRESAEFPLGQICAVSQGATPGGSNDFGLRSVVVMDRATAREHGLERETLVPVVGGRDIQDLMLPRPDLVALYPYSRTGRLLDLGAGIDAASTSDARRKLNRLIAQDRIAYPNAARFLVGYYDELRHREFERVGVDVS